jgi:AAA domain
MNATLSTAGPAPGAPSGPTFLRTDDRSRLNRPDPGWLWHGYLAPGGITLLTGQPKLGKTTLVSVLLAKLEFSGELAGRTVRAGRAVVVSEEDKSQWEERHDQLGFGPNVGFLCRPFQVRAKADDWRSLIDHLAALRRGPGLDLVVIDSLATFFPGRSENHARHVLDMVLPLRRLTDLGVGVLIIHHPKKRPAAPGRAARSSTALTRNVDIYLEMNAVGPWGGDDRRRELLGFSPWPDTPRRLVIELTAEGTDYAALGDPNLPPLSNGREVLLRVLASANGPVTQRQILRSWPADYLKPNDTTLWRWLDREVKNGRIRCSGRGRPWNGSAYWLAGREEESPMTNALPMTKEQGMSNDE